MQLLQFTANCINNCSLQSTANCTAIDYEANCKLHLLQFVCEKLQTFFLQKKVATAIIAVIAVIAVLTAKFLLNLLQLLQFDSSLTANCKSYCN
jgi:hypothetical protein